MKIKFYRHIFEKYTNIKFHEYPPRGADLFDSGRQTGRHDEVNSRFSKFCESA